MSKRFLHRLWVSVCPVMLIVATANAQTEKTKKEKSERVEALRLADAWLDSVQAYQHIPALSAGIVVADDLIWAKGYGAIDEQHSVPATPKTIYSICSSQSCLRRLP